MIGVEKWRNYYLRGKLFKMRAALKRAEDENMGGRRAFGPRDECLCASLSLFLPEARLALALQTVFRLLLRGYSGDHRTHGGRERRLGEGGVGEGKNRWIDGYMDPCAAGDECAGRAVSLGQEKRRGG